MECLRDFRLAARILVRERNFAVPVVLTLALTLGVQVVSFSLFDSLRLKPLPIRTSRNLVRLVVLNPLSQRPLRWSYPDFLDLRKTSHAVFSGVTIFATRSLIGRYRHRTAHVVAADVSGSFFRVVGLRAVKGRVFTPDDDSSTARLVAVVTEPFAQQELGGHAVGKTVDLNHQTFTVVGVVKAHEVVEALGEPNLFLPVHAVAAVASGNRLNSRSRWASVLARVQTGISADQMEAFLRIESARLTRNTPQRNGGLRLNAVPAGTYAGLRGTRSDSVVQAATVVWAVSLLLMLIGLANCASLFLVRATRNMHETSIRLALGASRWRLGRRLFAEALVICTIAGGVSWIVAATLLDAVRLLPQAATVEPVLDFRALAYTGAMLAFSVIFFALTPLVAASDGGLQKRLQVRRAAPLPKALRFRRAMAVGQVGLSILLLVGTALMLRTLVALKEVDLGFKASGLLVVDLDFRSLTGGLATPPSASQLATLTRAVEDLPAVDAVSFGDETPLDGIEKTSSMLIPGYAPRPGEEVAPHLLTVSDGYFRTLGVPLVAGDVFEGLPPDRTAVAIVNQAMAQRYWPGMSAVGRQVQVHHESLTIVGVTGDIRATDPAVSPHPTLFVRYPDSAFAYLHMIVRSKDRSVVNLERPIREVIQRTLPQIIITGQISMAERLDDLSATRQELAGALAFFGALALFIASLGLFSVVAYDASTREAEFGVRLAIGASPSDLFKQTVFHTLRIALAGVILGLLLSFAAGSLLNHFLFGVRPMDSASLIGAALVMLAFALAASAVPAWRISRLNPAETLRE
jgi:predicted permease